MLLTALSTLGQIAANKLQSDTPRIEPPSNAVTYIILSVLVVGTLLIVFKNSKRNNMMDEQ